MCCELIEHLFFWCDWVDCLWSLSFIYSACHGFDAILQGRSCGLGLISGDPLRGIQLFFLFQLQFFGLCGGRGIEEYGMELRLLDLFG